MQTQHGSRSYAVHSKTSGNLPCPQLKHHAMSRDSEVRRFRRLFNSPSGEFPGISPISSLKRVTWQLQVDQKTKAKGRRQRGSDPDLEIDQGEETRWRNCVFFFLFSKIRTNLQGNLHVRQRNGTNVGRAWFFFGLARVLWLYCAKRG